MSGFGYLVQLRKTVEDYFNIWMTGYRSVEEFKLANVDVNQLDVGLLQNAMSPKSVVWYENQLEKPPRGLTGSVGQCHVARLPHDEKK